MPKPLRQVTVKVILPEGKLGDYQKFHAPAGCAYSEANIENVVEHVINHLDKKYPLWDFRMIRIGQGKFVFAYAGLRENVDELIGKNAAGLPIITVKKGVSDGDAALVSEGERPKLDAEEVSNAESDISPDVVGAEGG